MLEKQIASMGGLVILGMMGVFIVSACQSASDVKKQQYFVQGEQLYQVHCSNCHQKEGTGLGLIYPPLHTSDFMEANMPQVLCMIKHGKTGPLMVNGQEYNQAMPGVPTLTDLELAEIATYIYNNWDHQRGIVSLEAVSNALASCSE